MVEGKFKQDEVLSFCVLGEMVRTQSNMPVPAPFSPFAHWTRLARPVVGCTSCHGQVACTNGMVCSLQICIWERMSVDVQ